MSFNERQTRVGGVVSGMADETNKDEALAAREKRIRSEKARLSRMLNKRGIDPELKRGVTSLINRAAFYTITLEDLEAEINQDGCSVEYQNGENQWGTKQSPAVQSHASFGQRLFSVMKQLTDLLPESDSKKPKDALLDFVNGR